MANSALEPLRQALDKRAAGVKLSPQELALCRKDLRGLERAADPNDPERPKNIPVGWFRGGSENIAVGAAAAAGRYDLVAAMCMFAVIAGLFGSEAGSASSFYFGYVISAVMVALRDARAAGEIAMVAAMERWLLAVWAWEALVSVRIPGDGGAAAAIAGNRNKHGVEDSGHRGEILAHALDLPRPGKGVRASAACLSLCGTKKYNQTTAPEPWGLNAETRALLVDVVDGDKAAAREAVALMLGTQPSDRWELLRTTEGAQKIFFGMPNGNGPAIAAGKVYADGRKQETLEPEDRVENSNPEWRVERDGCAIRASVRGRPEVAMAEIGGDVLWRVTVEGTNVHFE